MRGAGEARTDPGPWAVSHLAGPDDLVIAGELTLGEMTVERQRARYVSTVSGLDGDAGSLNMNDRCRLFLPESPA